LLALRYCCNTEAGGRARLESWMPLEVVQAGTALRSTAQLGFRLVVLPAYLACLADVAVESIT
jgi:hypothetical protein